VPLAGQLRDDVALWVHDGEGRPGAGRVGLPGEQVRVVEDGVVHLVALDRGRERDRVGLVRELGGVHPDHDQDVRELGLDLAQLVEHVQAVDAAEGPEVEQDDPPAQGRQAQLLPARAEPAAPRQLRGPDPSTTPTPGPDRRGVRGGRAAGGIGAGRRGGHGQIQP
jgi:hypothetical protein